MLMAYLRCLPLGAVFRRVGAQVMSLWVAVGYVRPAMKHAASIVLRIQGLVSNVITASPSQMPPHGDQHACTKVQSLDEPLEASHGFVTPRACSWLACVALLPYTPVATYVATYTHMHARSLTHGSIRGTQRARQNINNGFPTHVHQDLSRGRYSQRHSFFLSTYVRTYTVVS